MATTIPHKFNIVRFQHPELITDIEKFLLVSIFKMATTKKERRGRIRIRIIIIKIKIKIIIRNGAKTISLPNFGRLNKI
jgi:hypothetical protein